MRVLSRYALKTLYPRPALLAVLLPLVLAITLVPGAGAQTLSFTYVGPTASMVSNFGAANLSGGFVNGYRGVPLTAANLATFQNAAPPHLLRTYNQLQTGTTLRQRVDDVMQISGGKVDIRVLLVDDRTGLGSHDGIFATATVNNKRAVWPAASVSASGCTTNDYCALIRLGELASGRIQNRPGAWMAWEGTILHESLHTQMVGVHTKWSTVLITYGGDDSHWRSELLGDQPLSMEEGMGTFYGNMHNAAGMVDIVNFFRRTDERYLLESRSVLAGTPALWNAPHTEEERPIPETAAQTGRYLVRSYKWKDVPGFYLLFSESTSTAFYGMFWKYVNGNQGQALEMVNATAGAMWQSQRKRYLAYGVNRLALALEDFARTPEGQGAKRAGTLTSSMFAFALLDILTHFGMAEDEFRLEYTRQYPDRHPQAFTEYWSHRQAVKTLVQGNLNASPILIEEAIRAANRYFQESSRILETP